MKKYYSYFGNILIQSLHKGAKTVVAVCKGGIPVWRKPYTYSLSMGNGPTHTVPCDCDTLVFRGTYGRASHGDCNGRIFINGTNVYNTGSPSNAGQTYNFSYTYKNPVKAGTSIRFYTSGPSGYHWGSCSVSATNGYYPY